MWRKLVSLAVQICVDTVMQRGQKQREEVDWVQKAFTEVSSLSKNNLGHQIRDNKHLEKKKYSKFSVFINSSLKPEVGELFQCWGSWDLSCSNSILPHSLKAVINKIWINNHGCRPIHFIYGQWHLNFKNFHFKNYSFYLSSTIKHKVIPRS